MPSGFQQDSNQLQAEMYRATITMSNTTYYPTTSQTDGDNNGGVTPNASDSFATLPTTLVLGKARARGNMRFRNIVNRLTGLGDCQIRDITITEANGSAQATTFSFTVAYERPGFIPLTGTAIDGSTAITTIPIALKNAIAQGIRDASSALVRVYDPTNGDTQQTIAVTATSSTAGETYGTVAVTIIDESTLFD